MPLDKSLILKESSIAVACHDAGGANLTQAFILNNMPNDLKVYLEGPAKAIFSNFFPKLKNEESLSKILNLSLIHI